MFYSYFERKNDKVLTICINIFILLFFIYYYFHYTFLLFSLLYFDILCISIFINNTFSFLTTCDMCKYVDDSTLYTYSRDFHQFQEYLKKDFEILEKWFYNP